MAKRSTRNKIRYQAREAIKKATAIQQHLKNIDDLCEKRSEVVNQAMPGIVEMSELFLTTLTALRNAL